MILLNVKLHNQITGVHIKAEKSSDSARARGLARLLLNDITGNIKRTEMITCSSSYFSQFGKTNITIHRNELQVVALTHQ